MTLRCLRELLFRKGWRKIGVAPNETFEIWSNQTNYRIPVPVAEDIEDWEDRINDIFEWIEAGRRHDD